MPQTINYRSRILDTPTRSESKARFKALMLSYHDYRMRTDLPDRDKLDALKQWQSDRLISSYHTYYQDTRYHEGLKYLFSDLYASADFTQRDQDLERIFPKLTRYLPNRVIDTVSTIVELNLLTQELDEHMLEALNDAELTAASYCASYRACANAEARLRQIELVQEAGSLLEKYATNSAVQFGMSISEAPANMAGLNELYAFIKRGFSAFATMSEVSELLAHISKTERQYAIEIFSGARNNFTD